MAGSKSTKIGLKEVRALPPGETWWDAGPGAVPGFGIRRQRSEAISYVLTYRTLEGRLRWHTIGRHGAPWTPDGARAEARRLLGEVVKGVDPSAEKKAKRTAATVSELCDLYLADAEAGRLLTRRGVAKKPSTLLTDRSRVEAHIRPLLGGLKVPAVTREDVETFMHRIADGSTAQRTKTGKKRGLSNIRGGKGAASRTVGLLGAIFAYAERKRLIMDNPVRGVVRYADGQRERRLSDDEYRALGRGLAAAAEVKSGRGGEPGKAAVWPDAVACTRFLALTGWRSGEALMLRWRSVDLIRRTVRLEDTKTGGSIRPLSTTACDLLRSLGPGIGDSLVFTASRGEGAMTGFPNVFARICKLSKLPEDVTPHVLRHSFMSLGNDLGFTEATIGMICGHKGYGRTMTRGYIHGADSVLLAAADRIAGTTAERMGEKVPADNVVPLRGTA